MLVMEINYYHHLTIAVAPLQLLTKQRLHELVKEVDPNEQLDEEVEELLLQLADDFIESTVSTACQLAKHRKAATVDVKDVQLYLGQCGGGGCIRYHIPSAFFIERKLTVNRCLSTPVYRRDRNTAIYRLMVCVNTKLYIQFQVLC